MRLPFFEGVNVQEVVMPAQDDQGEGQMQGMAKVQQHTNEGGIPSSTDKKSMMMMMMMQQEQQQLEQPEMNEGMTQHMGKMHILHSLRESHQKLKEEVVSLRATVTSVSNEEVETQKEITQLTNEIGNLTVELNELKQSIEDVKLKFDENMKKTAILKVQLEKNAAVEEANDSAIQQPCAKVEVSVVAPTVDTPQSMEAADLLSWDAPIAVQETMPSLESDEPFIRHDSSSVAQDSAQLPIPAPFDSSDTDVSSVSQSSTVAISEDERDVVLSPSPVDLNPNAFLDFGAPMGEVPLQQQLNQQKSVMSPLEGGIPGPMVFDYQESPQTALTPPSSVEQSFNSCDEEADMSALEGKKHEKIP